MEAFMLVEICQSRRRATMQNEKRYTDWCSTSPKQKHWNISVKEKSLPITSFPLSLLYQHQSVVARKTEKLEIIPVSSHRLRLFSFLHTGGCKSFQRRRHVMRCRRVGRVICDSKNLFKAELSFERTTLHGYSAYLYTNIKAPKIPNGYMLIIF